jgi:hypothetical protein
VVVKVPDGVVYISASCVGLGGGRCVVLARRRIRRWRRTEDVREGGDGVCSLPFGGVLVEELAY